MDLPELYARCSEEFVGRTRLIEGRWGAPTPCAGWDVAELVNHLVREQRWAPVLLAGATIAEVGGRFDGDLLGADPIATIEESSTAAVAAVSEPGVAERTVHLSFGDHPGREYVEQLAADHLVHAWDLARALGEDPALDAELVVWAVEWFGPRQEVYRGLGVIAVRRAPPEDAPAQDRLLAMFGRQVTRRDAAARPDAAGGPDR